MHRAVPERGCPIFYKKFALHCKIPTFASELRCSCSVREQLIIGNPVRIRNCTRSCNLQMFNRLSWPLSKMMGRRLERSKSEDLPQFFNLRISGKDFRRTLFKCSLKIYRECALAPFACCMYSYMFSVPLMPTGRMLFLCSRRKRWPIPLPLP